MKNFILFVFNLIVNFFARFVCVKKKKQTEKEKFLAFKKQLEKECTDLTGYLPKNPYTAVDDEFEDFDDCLDRSKCIVKDYKRLLIRIKAKEIEERQLTNLDSLPFCRDIKIHIGKFYLERI